MEQIGLSGIFDLSNFDKGISSYLSGIKKAEGATEATKGKFGAAFDDMGNGVLKVAGLMSGALVAASVAAGAAVSAFVVSGINKAGDLGAQMGAIAAVMGKTKDAVGPLKDLILDLGLDPTLKVNAQEAADAIEKLASNGLGMTEIMGGAAKATVLLANATQADFGTAAAIATDTMALFNIDAEHMMEAVDGITGVVNNSKFTIHDYQLALAQGGGVASAVGVEFDDFNTAIAGTSSLFKSGSDAGTSFKTLLQRLIPQSAEATTVMQELGLMTAEGANQFYDAAGNLKDMNEISVLLESALSGLSEEQKNNALSTMFGADAMRAAVGLAEQGEIAYTDQALAAKELGVSYDSLTVAMEGGLTKFEALAAQLGNTDAAESAKVRMDNFKGSMEILQGVIDTVALKIGFAFLPMLKEMADRVSEFVSANSEQIIAFFEGFAGAIERLVSGAPWQEVFPTWLVGVIEAVTSNMDLLLGALGGVAALLASAGIAAAFTAIGAAMAGLLSPMVLMIAGAAALGAAWNTNFLGMKDATIYIFDEIVQGAFGPFTVALQELGTSALAEIWAFVNGNSIGFVALTTIWNSAIVSVQNLFTSIVTAVTTNLPLWQAQLMEWGAAAWGWIVEASGIAATKIGEWATALLGALASNLPTIIATLIEWSAALVTWIASAIAGGITMLGTWASALVGWITGEGKTQIGGGALQLVGALIDWIANDLIPKVAPALGEFGAALADGVVKIAASMGVDARKIATAIVDAIMKTDYKAIGINILTFIRDGWNATVGTVTTIVKTFADGIKTKFTEVDWTAVGSDILTFIKDGIMAIAPGVLTSLSTIVTNIKDKFSDTVNNWTATGKDILEKVRTGIESAKVTTLATITTIVADMKHRYVTPDGFAWSTIGGDISNAIRDGIDAAAKAAGGLLTVVKNMGMDLMKSFTEINWEEVGRSMARLLKDGFKALAEGAGGLLPTAKSTGQSMLDAFKDIDWLALGRSIINGILTGIKAIAYGAGGLIYIVAEIVKGFTEELFGVDWNEQGQKIIQNIQSGIEAAKSKFMEIVKGIPAGIKQIFTDMTEEFKKIGTAIVDGIGAGITGAKDALMKKAQDLANALPGWVKEILGISSPSKVFAEIGRNIIDGLIVGVNEMTPKLQSTMQAISSKISGEDLLGISFSSSDTFTSRLRDEYLDPFVKFAEEMKQKRQELQSFIANLTKTLNSGTLNGTQIAQYVSLIKSASDKLASMSNTPAEQQLVNMQNVLAGSNEAKERLAFYEDQIALMQEAKKLGIDVTGIGIGDTSAANVIKMANIEKRIAELKKEQLFYTALQLQQSTKQIEQYKGLKDAIVHVETYNSHLSDQLAMMKKAEQLGLDLSKLWAGGIIRDPNDTGRLLQLQLQIASATGASLENQMNTMIAEQKRVKGLEGALSQLQPLIDQTNVSSAFGQKYKAEVLDPMLRALEKSAGIDSERLRLINEYTAAAQKLVEINKKEDQLSFLRQQMDVIKMIKDQDLVGGNSLFDGIAFGVNASIDDLLTLTNRVLNAMITEVKDELGIHSPSQVFADIGGQMMAGLSQGIQKGFMQPLNALRQGTVAHGSMSSRTLNFAMGGVTINTPMDEVMFESRVLRILERSMN